LKLDDPRLLAVMQALTCFSRGRSRSRTAALEVLAIVAYRHPIARSGIEHIRGSTSDSAIATLLEARADRPEAAPLVRDNARISGIHGAELHCRSAAMPENH
jgi:Segregation and condensation complex subunit ScpB